jgi:oligosaccharide repeat unit polymerase
MLYIFSGPISIIYGAGLNEYFYPRPYYVCEYFIFSSISIASFTLGFLKKTCINNQQQSDKEHMNSFDANCLGYTAILFALLTSLTEIINFIRVGGMTTVLQGKATYQSAVSDLVLTLPSDIISYVAFGVIGAYLGCIRGRRLFSDKNLNLYILFLLPYLSLKILVGFRGILLGSLLILILGYNYNKVTSKVKPKLIIGVLAVYIIMVLISSARGIAPYYIQSGEYKLLINTMLSNERIETYINPASNEYGVAFGNFNLFYQLTKGKNEYMLGKSYLAGLSTVIPSFLYPGKKPQTIIYEFRDKYMPYEKQRGSVASHGFSFMLEGYMNFGVIGIIIIYFLIGRLFFKLEDKKGSSNSLVYLVYYISCIATITTFHRSHFGHIFSSNATLLLFIVFSKTLNEVILVLSKRINTKRHFTPKRRLNIPDNVMNKGIINSKT